jgi:hypothetical protein
VSIGGRRVRPKFEQRFFRQIIMLCDPRDGASQDTTRGPNVMESAELDRGRSDTKQTMSFSFECTQACVSRESLTTAS